MAQVEFKSAVIEAHGYPQACLTCGNDEDNQLVSRQLTQTKSWSLGCAGLLFFFGPIGWLIAAALYIVSNRDKTKFGVPVCLLCNEAMRKAGNRCGLFLLLSGLLFFGGFYLGVAKNQDTLCGWSILASFVIGLYALLEYFWISRPFQVRVVKLNSERMVVEVANDDYPGLYQRHVDNALLYGSSDSTGTRAES